MLNLNGRSNLTRFMGLINAGRPFCETSRGGRHFKTQLCQILQCAKIKNAHRPTIVGVLAARHLTINLTKFSNPNKTMKKISVVLFSNPIQPGEKFIKRTFLKKCKEKGLNDSEAALKFDQLIMSGEFKVCNEPTENRFERTIEIFFRKKC